MPQQPKSIDMEPKFSIVITTKDRLLDLQNTLVIIAPFIAREDTECIICDDGSKDGTAAYINYNFPQIQLLRHLKSKGLICSRNYLFTMARGIYVISLDDDAHFLSKDALRTAETYFKENEKCGLIAFRIYWGKKQLEFYDHFDSPHRVQGYVGCGHIWNMKAWQEIPNYPEWFVFYGEELFAAFHLFKKGWEIHYVPDILIQHRVDVKARKKDLDYYIRMRYSLRSGWYIYLLFYPWRKIPKKFAYTLWRQLKLKVFKGDLRAGWALMRALADVIYNLPRILRNSNRLTAEEFKEFSKLAQTKMYWKPER